MIHLYEARITAITEVTVPTLWNRILLLGRMLQIMVVKGFPHWLRFWKIVVPPTSSIIQSLTVHAFTPHPGNQSSVSVIGWNSHNWLVRTVSFQCIWRNTVILILNDTLLPSFLLHSCLKKSLSDFQTILIRGVTLRTKLCTRASFTQGSLLYSSNTHLLSEFLFYVIYKNYIIGYHPLCTVSTLTFTLCGLDEIDQVNLSTWKIKVRKTVFVKM